MDGFWIDCPACNGKKQFTVLLYHTFKCTECDGFGEVFIVNILKVLNGDVKCKAFKGFRRQGINNLIYPSKSIWIDKN